MSDTSPRPSARTLRALLEAGRVTDAQVAADVPGLLQAAAERLRRIAEGIDAAADLAAAGDGGPDAMQECLLAAQLQVAFAVRSAEGAGLTDLHDLVLTLIARSPD